MASPIGSKWSLSLSYLSEPAPNIMHNQTTSPPPPVLFKFTLTQFVNYILYIHSKQKKKRKLYVCILYMCIYEIKIYRCQKNVDKKCSC